VGIGDVFGKRLVLHSLVGFDQGALGLKRLVDVTEGGM
jgi:hypothetical protein